VEVTIGGEHASELQYGKSYWRKRFYATGPRCLYDCNNFCQYYKTTMLGLCKLRSKLKVSCPLEGMRGRGLGRVWRRHPLAIENLQEERHPPWTGTSFYNNIFVLLALKATGLAQFSPV